jgi:hypothetical protein
MTSRRSLRHLGLLAVVCGAITLYVALSNADSVWLAVGPLLVGVIDSLAFSPLVSSRLASGV